MAERASAPIANHHPLICPAHWLLVDELDGSLGTRLYQTSCC